MNANSLTPGVVFAIDELLRHDHSEAAQTLLRTTGIRFSDPADRAVIHALKSDQSIDPLTVQFIREYRRKPVPK